MKTANRRPAWRAVLAIVMVAAGSTLAAIVTATPAQARCNGNGVPVTMVLRNSAGATLAREIPVSGTCNGNNHYQGAVEDSRTDGSCATVTLFNSAGAFLDDATECTTGGQQGFGCGSGGGTRCGVGHTP